MMSSQRIVRIRGVLSALSLLLFAAAFPAEASSLPQVFTKYFYKTEGAYFVLVPRGWITQGEIVRVSPLTAQGGVGNATDAKIDFAVARDASGKVQIRWLPKINYAQPPRPTPCWGATGTGCPS